MVGSPPTGCLAETTVLCAARNRHEEAQLVDCVRQLNGTALTLEDVGDAKINADFLVSAGVLTKAFKVFTTISSALTSSPNTHSTSCHDSHRF